MQTRLRIIIFILLIAVVIIIYKFQYLITNLFKSPPKTPTNTDIDVGNEATNTTPVINSSDNSLQLALDKKNDDIECVSLGNVSKYSLSETTTDRSKLLESLYRGL